MRCIVVNKAFHCRCFVVVLAAVTPFSSPALAQGGPQPVALTAIVERDLPATTKLVGTVMPDRSALVASEVAGPTLSYDATEGQFLKKGDPICHIDPEVPTQKLNQAKAELESLTQRLTELERGTRAEELKRWDAALEEAKAIFEKWKFERSRIAGLFEASQSSEKERHDTEMEYQASSRRLAQIDAQLEEAKNGPRPEQIAQARFKVAGQQANVALLQRELDRAVIRAPFDGFIVEKRTEVGEWIVAGGPVAEMVAVETVKVRADIPQSIVMHARTGEAARVEIEAIGRFSDARISRVIPKAAVSARTIPVEIDLPNADHALVPGMFVWVHVPSGPTGKRLMVSKDAIVSRGSVKQMFVARADSNGGWMAQPLQVATGMELGSEIEIQCDGVRAGDMAVSRNNERLFGPMPIAPMNLPVSSQPAANVARSNEPAK